MFSVPEYLYGNVLAVRPTTVFRVVCESECQMFVHQKYLLGRWGDFSWNVTSVNDWDVEGNMLTVGYSARHKVLDSILEIAGLILWREGHEDACWYISTPDGYKDSVAYLFSCETGSYVHVIALDV
jgi:hypothetical protein